MRLAQGLRATGPLCTRCRPPEGNPPNSVPPPRYGSWVRPTSAYRYGDVHLTADELSEDRDRLKVTVIASGGRSLQENGDHRRKWRRCPFPISEDVYKSFRFSRLLSMVRRIGRNSCARLPWMIARPLDSLSVVVAVVVVAVVVVAVVVAVIGYEYEADAHFGPR